MQHARSMATGTRSLPTDSPIPYFQPIERGYMSEGSQEGVYATPYVDPSEHTVNIGGVLITILKSQKQIEYQLLLGRMIMIPCLLLDMAEEHCSQFLR